MMRPRLLTAVFLLLALVSAPAQTGTPAKPASPPVVDTPQSKGSVKGIPAKERRQAKKQAQPWTKIPIPKLPDFKPQVPVRVELPNGMVLFLQEDHELPLISATMRIRGGDVLEPAARVGLVEMYGEVWRTGGTEKRTGDQLDDFLEARAAKVETGGGTDSTSISLNCLKQDFDDVFNVFVELLRTPAFREDKLPLAKQQLHTAIARRNDDPGSIASRESTVLGYGRENPYARYPEYATVDAVTRNDLVDWHKRFVHPNNIIFGLVGDFDAKQMEARIRQTFADWQKGPDAPKPEVKFTDAKPGLYFVEKGDVNQSNIQMVALGIRRDNPDYFALTVMNEALGGGFSARLFSNIRTRLGLAYSVGGGVGAAYDHPGLIRFAMGTKTESTGEAVKALYEQIDRMTVDPPNEFEMKLAKDAILNSFVFRFDEPSEVLAERMSYEFYGYPQDFLERYRKGVEATTGADVARVAKKYLKRNELAVLVVGAPDARKDVATFGTLTPVDITIPAPDGGAAAPKVGATTPEAKALMTKVVEGMGGVAKLKAIQSVRAKARMTLKTAMGEVPIDTEQVLVFPDRMWSKLNTPQGELTMVVTPQSAFAEMGSKGMQDLPPSARSETMASIKRDQTTVARSIDDPKYSFAIGGKEKVGEVEAVILDINADGVPLRWWVNPANGRVLRSSYQASRQGAPVQRVVNHSEFKAFDGVTVSTKGSIIENGQPAGSAEVLEFQVNPQVDPRMFEKPVK